jgi:type VI protein secretion system component VasF
VAKEQRYERETVVVAYGNTGVAPMYFLKLEQRLPNIVYDRRTRIFGYIVTALMILALAAVYMFYILTC